MASSFYLFAIVCALASLHPSIAADSHWNQFRGSTANSVVTEQRLPEAFNQDLEARWKTRLPVGHSSPCIWKDRIFITGFDEPTMQLRMFCLDRDNGAILWTISRPLRELQQYAHKASSPSVPTPCTDGRRVAFLFGDYGLVVADFDGNELWEKPFVPYGNDSGMGYGASPILADGKLLVNCDGGIRPGLLCLDFKTGEELWHASRPNTIVSYASPFVWRRGDKTEVLQAGTAQLASYDLADGNPLWQVNNLPIFVCPTPTADASTVYYGAWTTGNVSGASRIKSLFSEQDEITDEQASNPDAFFARFDANQDRKLAPEELPPSRLRDAFNFGDHDRSGFLEYEEFEPIFEEADPSDTPGRNVFVAITKDGRGDITDTHVKWELRKNLPYVSSPLLYENRLYLVKKGGTVSCLNPQTGEAHFERGRLGAYGEYYASPIGVDGKVLIASQPGTVTIIKASDELEILDSVDMGEAITASLAMADSRLYIRTENYLWAF